MPPSKPVHVKIRSKIPPPRGLTGRDRLIFRDNANNRLFARRKPDGTVQFSGKNGENHQLNIDGIKTMMRRWNRQR